ncbi:ABC transporter ATP-binding protein [Streptomyces sp. NPDC002668]|uniref:ABC transporter ATP-binding protein n=1 Tax=Streptomyces sp. NPDC002668 TaxID=3154422 RepID=UPI00332D9355
MPDSRPILEVRRLSKDFKGFRAVNEVDLHIAEGTVHALVGPNGAGKTTLFHLLTGFLKPTSGQILWGETNIAGYPPERIARLGIARSFQVTSLFPDQTPVEHLELALQSTVAHRFWSSQRVLMKYRSRAMDLLDEVGLAAHAHRAVGGLSYGHKRALEIALALSSEPRLILLDEPTAGMGIEDIDRTVALIDRVRAGRTVVMVEHNMSVVGSLADQVTVLQRGSILAQGPYTVVRADPQVITAYLGDADART